MGVIEAPAVITVRRICGRGKCEVLNDESGESEHDELVAWYV